MAAAAAALRQCWWVIDIGDRPSRAARRWCTQKKLWINESRTGLQGTFGFGMRLRIFSRSLHLSRPFQSAPWLSLLARSGHRCWKCVDPLYAMCPDVLALPSGFSGGSWRCPVSTLRRTVIRI